MSWRPPDRRARSSERLASIKQDVEALAATFRATKLQARCMPLRFQTGPAWGKPCSLHLEGSSGRAVVQLRRPLRRELRTTPALDLRETPFPGHAQGDLPASDLRAVCRGQGVSLECRLLGSSMAGTKINQPGIRPNMSAHALDLQETLFLRRHCWPPSRFWRLQQLQRDLCHKSNFEPWLGKWQDLL